MKAKLNLRPSNVFGTFLVAMVLHGNIDLMAQVQSDLRPIEGNHPAQECFASLTDDCTDMIGTWIVYENWFRADNNKPMKLVTHGKGMYKEWQLRSDRSVHYKTTNMLGQNISATGSWSCKGDKFSIAIASSNGQSPGDHTFTLLPDKHTAEEKIDTSDSDGRMRMYTLLKKQN